MKAPDSIQAFDIVIPVGPNDADIAISAIRYIFKYFSFRKILIVAGEKSYRALNVKDARISFIHEDELIEGITLVEVKKYCETLFGDPSRGGWYFQQFLKMAICRYPGIAEYYLVWDADTIPLKPLHFFDTSGKMLLSTGKEHHQPYFDTMQKITGLHKQVSFSFITEHMVISKKVMQELIGSIEANNIDGKTWVEKILLAVDKKNYLSGFSEYETYGNYILAHYPNSVSFRKIKHKRSGSKITRSPGALLLKILSLFRDTVSFEKGHT